jgi:hypothetical protein
MRLKRKLQHAAAYCRRSDFMSDDDARLVVDTKQTFIRPDKTGPAQLWLGWHRIAQHAACDVRRALAAWC